MDEYTPFKDIAVPTEITVNGRVYVDKEELSALIKSEKMKFLDGTKKGYIAKEESERIAAMLSLNRLQAILHREEAGERIREIMEGK